MNYKFGDVVIVGTTKVSKGRVVYRKAIGLILEASSIYKRDRVAIRSVWDNGNVKGVSVWGVGEDALFGKLERFNPESIGKTIMLEMLMEKNKYIRNELKKAFDTNKEKYTGVDWS
jgi:hypothetical protein